MNETPTPSADLSDDSWLDDIDLDAAVPAKPARKTRKSKRFTERDYIPPQRYVAKRGPDVQRPVVEILGRFEDSADVASIQLPSRHLDRLLQMISFERTCHAPTDAELDRIQSILRVAASQLTTVPAPIARPNHQYDLFIPFVEPKEFKR